MALQEIALHQRLNAGEISPENVKTNPAIIIYRYGTIRIRWDVGIRGFRKFFADLRSYISGLVALQEIDPYQRSNAEEISPETSQTNPWTILYRY